MTDVQAQPAAQPGNWVDPYLSRNFKLLINNVTGALFTGVSGLGFSIENISFREAGNNTIVRAVPGRITYTPVLLSAGMSASAELWDWIATVVRGKVSRRNVSIAMLDSTGSSEVMRWNLLNAWPQEWRSGPLDAMSRELAIESLVLAHEGLEREAGGAPTATA